MVTYEFWHSFFPISVNNELGILIGITLDLSTAFCRMAIFTVLILPIHEHGIPLVSNVFLCPYIQKFKVFIIEVLHLLD